MNRITAFFLLLITFFASCKEHKKLPEKEIVSKPAEINKTATDIIKEALSQLSSNEHIEGFPALKNISVLEKLYNETKYVPIWTGEGRWNANGDSLYTLIDSARYFGLFPKDYYTDELNDLREKQLYDTSSREEKLDAALWAKTDLLLTDAFVQIVKDLKNGRLLRDTTVIKKDTVLADSFFTHKLQMLKDSSISAFTSTLEPMHSGYHNLKAALRDFLEDADFRPYTYINPEDSLNLMDATLKRLEEDSIVADSSITTDSLRLKSVIKKYQKRKEWKVDGKLTSSVINSLNNNDCEKFIRIAITLDRYKQLPDKLPSQYIWVNIPEYYMYVKENDTVKLKSKVVVGKPITHTPVLSSAITDMITYPQWTIPESIIKKEILPGLKKDPGYTQKKGFSLIDKDGNEVDPYFVDWSRYEKGIPYKVVQGSGDDNALGVMKFNFSNKYFVYLHDTNQRYLFSKKTRALSHGCVRVQNWDSLAYYILRSDSLASKKALPVDSLNKWLALKEKHVIPVRKRIPLFIRYFTCDTKDGKLIFYDDVYGDDRRLKQKFFANKI